MAIEKIISYNLYKANQKTDSCQILNLNVSNTNSTFVVHRSLIKQNQDKRQGTASTKTRSEVRGGGKKPWKQKGTGKARAGSIRSPLWRGGGVIFGPKTKHYKLKINQKEKQLAIRNVIANKTQSAILIDEKELFFSEPKTRLLVEKLHSLGMKLTEKILIIVKEKPRNLYLSTRNLGNVELIQANHLNIRSLLNANKFLLTNLSIPIINEVYNVNK
uniref:Large ribosomal subunit protein uL4c n=1 Tax=Trichogloeopsis pedicellata TaxID=1495610 RepID=A0A1G4P0M7_9FLOR|nr:Ribosomal protein L4 [Trichogloeopsis pedicellata]SCW24447.1 Ribosomal protein L4 [Trichogloeopsis pedicellata]